MRWVASLALIVVSLATGWPPRVDGARAHPPTAVTLPVADAPPLRRLDVLPCLMQKVVVSAPAAGAPADVKRVPSPPWSAGLLVAVTTTDPPPHDSRQAPLAPPVPLLPPAAPPAPLIPLQLGSTRFSLFTVNPQFTAQDVAITLSTPAHVTIQIWSQEHTRSVRALDLSVQPAGTVQADWNGRDEAGRLVAPGGYDYRITATDAAGARVRESATGLAITYRRMVISLSHQTLTAYDGNTMVLSTLVTTGNAALPTPVGAFPILARYHPFTFISPWPLTSPYYYPPSPVNYALLFDNRGYFVHDAPWRSAFGPGSNAALGTPGQNYTGTHGCVNVPFGAAQVLFDWATIGTIVQVVP